MKQKLRTAIDEHINVVKQLEVLLKPIEDATSLIDTAFKQRKKVLSCGNGGSASDSQHFASELTGRFEMDRKGYPAFSLTTDTSALTAIGNDYGFNRIFARQVESIGHEGDVLLVISTSGNSENLIETVSQAQKQNIKTIGLLGRDGGKLGKLVDVPIIVSGERTSRIQEAHIFILHFICQHFETQ